MKYAVIEEKFVRTGPVVFGGKARGRYEQQIRIVDSLSEIKEGELYFPINEMVKKTGVFSREECVFYYCPQPNKCENKCASKP